MNIRFSLLLLLCPARTILAFSPSCCYGGICSPRHRLPSLRSSLLSNFDPPSPSVNQDFTFPHQSQQFDGPNKIKLSVPTLHGFIFQWVAVSLAAVIMLSFSLTSFPLPCYADDVVASEKDIIAKLGLKPPTDNKPQIKLTDGSFNSASTKSRAKTPILQGLVYFERAKDKPAGATSISTSTPSKEPLDYYSDILVLTAVSAKDPSGPVLAGAKFPVSSVRFPLSFSMYEQNLLLKHAGVKEAWEDVQNTSDVIIKAYICPGDAVAFPCEDREVKKYSEGVAKLITELSLPGLREGEVIRAPASLSLQ